ncbi:Sjoegren syndrome nuclear autoantigen 1 homolog isoform X2 [Schistocerca piceifrons]|uniref:Sjoegren syndrome nuclear autoantigen 1 homolog isoform X2 n=1 Tax=Schistocerca piceifrons TaxID=274613 RepID=UPI001F5EBECF|nr:Sjoegren syndrome nuclear autoantigen 1 homolog isoform X2 [Schistocerca piceifrons]
MAQHGALLQTYNQELVKCLEELKRTRGELQLQIDKAEEEKCLKEKELKKLSSDLSRINQVLDDKIAKRNALDKTISETEGAYVKILESSKVLLDMIRRETMTVKHSLTKKPVSKDLPVSNDVH